MTNDKAISFIKNLTLQANFDLVIDTIISGDGIYKNLSSIDEMLQQLEIQEHSIAILCLLVNKIQAKDLNIQQAFAQIHDFVTECDKEQIKQVQHLFCSLCHHLTDLLVESKQYLKGVELLTRAIPKVQQQPSQLTSIHTDLCKLCLLAKCLKPALPFLDVDITDIGKENDTFDVKYYLMYFYYGGIIYCTLRNFNRAFFFFQAAISIGGTAISEIMVEAYKKYVLVSLLVYGKLQPLPKNNQTYLNRCVKPFAADYHDLCAAYGSNDVDKVRETFAEYAETFARDTNVGLVKQVIASLLKVKIQKLTKTFMTLSLDDMAVRVNLPDEQEAEKMVLRMIDDEHIFASINQRDGMVLFLDKPEKYNTPKMYRLIEQDLNKCIQLNEILKKLDNDIALSPKYQRIRSVME